LEVGLLDLVCKEVAAVVSKLNACLEFGLKSKTIPPAARQRPPWMFGSRQDGSNIWVDLRALVHGDVITLLRFYTIH
jgi:hypothetical protein